MIAAFLAGMGDGMKILIKGRGRTLYSFISRSICEIFLQNQLEFLIFDERTFYIDHGMVMNVSLQANSDRLEITFCCSIKRHLSHGPTPLKKQNPKTLHALDAAYYCLFLICMLYSLFKAHKPLKEISLIHTNYGNRALFFFILKYNVRRNIVIAAAIINTNKKC